MLTVKTETKITVDRELTELECEEVYNALVEELGFEYDGDFTMLYGGTSEIADVAPGWAITGLVLMTERAHDHKTEIVELIELLVRADDDDEPATLCGVHEPGECFDSCEHAYRVSEEV